MRQGFGSSIQVVSRLIQRRWTQVVSLLVVSVVLAGCWVRPAQAENYDKRDLLKADLSNQVLTDSSFTKANLRESNLSHTDLRGVSLFGAHLEMANLEGANLTGATLDTADFRQANLTNAVLEGAYAFNANFDGAIIDGADFTDVLLRQDAQRKLCQRAKGVNPVTQRNTRDSLFCS